MPIFTYTVLRGPDETLTGEEEAIDSSTLTNTLMARGMHVLTVKESGGRSHDRFHYGVLGGLKRRELVQFTRDLAALLKAGLPLVQSLIKLRARMKQSAWGTVAETIQCRLEDGDTLSQALTVFPKLFDSMYVNLIRAGEEGGTLPEVLSRLAALGERRDEVRARVRMAMVYPAVMMGLGIVTVIVLLTFVVPMFTGIFADTDQVLPLPTRILMALSEFMVDGWIVVLMLIVGGGYSVYTFSHSPQGNRLLGQGILKVPYLNSIVELSEVASFAQTMGILLANGVPVLQALKVTENTLRNEAFREDVGAMHRSVFDGERLSSCLEKTGHFPDLVASVVGVGEESGTLSESLLQVAEDMERDLDRAIKVFMTLLEPIMIVGVGLIVGFIVMSIILPIFQLGDAFV